VPTNFAIISMTILWSLGMDWMKKGEKLKKNSTTFNGI
jgi:hypothetical protein